MLEGMIGAGAVALGALVGGPARLYLTNLVAERVGGAFPLGTLLVNVSGSFLIGCIGAYAEAHALSGQSPLWLLLATGVLGSYTTVSSFSLQTHALWRDREPAQAIGNLALSVLLCIAGAGAGFALVAAMIGHAR